MTFNLNHELELEDMHAPVISIIMCVYNGESYLREAIDSVLDQTFSDFELVIVDDGSTDTSVDIIHTYTDLRVRLIQHSRNIGLVAARNNALRCALGEYVAILDCDDIAYPERLVRQLRFLSQNPGFGMVGSWIEIIDGRGNPTGVVMRYPAAPNEIPSLLLFGNYFSQSSVLIRKACLPQEYYRPEYPVAEDYDLWVRLAAESKLWNIQEVLTKYRVHSPSTSFNKAELMEQCVRKIITNQLSLIGIVPSESEMDIHRSIGSLHFQVNIDFIGAAEAWLKRLCQANKRIKFFNCPIFEKVLSEKWYLLNRESTGLGFVAWLLFRKSELYQLTNLSIWQQFKFLIRCAVKWQRRN
jgi:glycosyltransferase involved in cell wall biosynthesis